MISQYFVMISQHFGLIFNYFVLILFKCICLLKGFYGDIRQKLRPHLDIGNHDVNAACAHGSHLLGKLPAVALHPQLEQLPPVAGCSQRISIRLCGGNAPLNLCQNGRTVCSKTLFLILQIFCQRIAQYLLLLFRVKADTYSFTLS